MKYPKSLEDLIESFSHLPSVGKKTAERFALYCLTYMDEADIIDFSNALIGIKKDIHICSMCGNISETDICTICQDSSRNHRQILVVENIKDLFTIEKINDFITYLTVFINITIVFYGEFVLNILFFLQMLLKPSFHLHKINLHLQAIRGQYVLF